jgi:ATP-dependent 26S proteasome regulatory subunit
MPDFEACRQTMLLYLKARIPFISLRTDERDRALELLRKSASDLNLPIYYHTLSQGVRDIVTNRVVNEDRSVAGALDFASQQILQRQNLTFVVTEVQDIDGDTPLSRQVLDICSSATERGGVVLVVTTSSIWPRLQRLGMTLTLDPPNEDEMRTIIAKLLSDYPNVPIEWHDAELAEAGTILAGVTQIEAENAIATFLAKGSILKTDLVELSKAKDRIFADISGLERVMNSAKDVTVGGLAGLHAWLEKQRPLLTMDLRERGLRPPRGVLLVGVPGCGKSLSAKAISASWKLPLYRLDLANIHGQYLGQSEARLKEALGTADRVAPCVLWIDEIEKGLAGSGGSSDGGTSTRLVGHFLYWLQEGRARVFVVATANDIAKLPPELFRRGRFDELFFVDLPNKEERQEIMGLYARRYLHRDLPPSLVTELVDFSDGFAGADIDAAVAEIAKEAILKGEAAADDAYWRKVFTNIVPLSKTNPEAIEAIRAWGRERAVPASGQPIAQEAGQPKARRSVLV